ncbi:MAG: hypothetical protein AB7K24_29760 [Gemmataceae bacterium]
MPSCASMFALAILLAPPDTQLVDLDGYQYLRPDLQGICVQLEILDPRELRYVLVRSEDFASDVTLLRRRHTELADAPPLADALRFPDREMVNDFLAFNRTYHENLESNYGLHLSRTEFYKAALDENEQLYRVWEAVRDARCEYYYVSVRRQALKKLRDQVGAERYFSGNLPPHVPLWRFHRVD